jgi:hypothetical protein
MPLANAPFALFCLIEGWPEGSTEHPPISVPDAPSNSGLRGAIGRFLGRARRPLRQPRRRPVDQLLVPKRLGDRRELVLVARQKERELFRFVVVHVGVGDDATSSRALVKARLI